MTETAPTYTLDPIAPSPFSLEARIARQDEQLRVNVAAMDLMSNRIAALEPSTAYGEVLTACSPHAHMRIQISRNTRGYTYETSVSVDADDPRALRESVEYLLRDADTIARKEIAKRELLDSNPAAAAAQAALDARKGMLADQMSDEEYEAEARNG